MNGISEDSQRDHAGTHRTHVAGQQDGALSLIQGSIQMLAPGNIEVRGQILR